MLLSISTWNNVSATVIVDSLVIYLFVDMDTCNEFMRRIIFIGQIGA